MGILKSSNKVGQHLPKLVDILRGFRQIISKLNFRLTQLAQLMNCELKPLLVLVDQTFNFKKIVLLKSVEHFVDVIPHLGFQLTASVAQRQRQVRLTGLLRLDLLRHHNESGGDHLILVADAIADEKVLHGMSEYRTKKAIEDVFCAGSARKPSPDAARIYVRSSPEWNPEEIQLRMNQRMPNFLCFFLLSFLASDSFSETVSTGLV